MLIYTTVLKEALVEKVSLKSIWTLLVVSGKTLPDLFEQDGYL